MIRKLRIHLVLSLLIMLAFMVSCMPSTAKEPIHVSAQISSTEQSSPPSIMHLQSIHQNDENNEAEACRQPIESYAIEEVGGHLLNFRSLDMLNYAYTLYGGKIDIRGPAITQGSYTLDSPESYFTHAGGGAVDISVYDKSGERWELLEDEIEALIFALRTAGFAAWYRPNDYERQGSPAHIHAIAIGDLFLSEQARYQLEGKCSYFYGLAGLPIMDYECKNVSQPRPDIHGGPIVCEWMCDLAYDSLADDIRCKNFWSNEP